MLATIIRDLAAGTASRGAHGREGGSQEIANEMSWWGEPVSHAKANRRKVRAVDECVQLCWLRVRMRGYAVVAVLQLNLGAVSELAPLGGLRPLRGAGACAVHTP